ncbi:MAG: CapA family protein [Gemmatimonadales bacterium]
MNARAVGLVALAALAACGGPPTPLQPAPARDTVPIPLPRPAPAPPVTPPPARIHAPVRVTFVGDINLGTLSLPDGVPPDSGRGLLDAARPALRGDLVVGNFEGVLGDSAVTTKCGTKPRQVGFQAVKDSVAHPPIPRRPHRKPPKEKAPKGPGCYAFLTPTGLAPRLVEAGFTHLNLANNHANDFGAAGRATTDSVFHELGITLYGPLGSIAIDSVRKGSGLTVVGLIGFTTYPFAYDLLDVERSAAVVDSIRPLVDLLLVTFHGGAEGIAALHTPDGADSLGHEQRGELRRWARAVIEAGADAVVGHGPHVPRGIEFYRGVPIVYSLGNFLTYSGFNLSGPLGLTGVLQLDFSAGQRLDGARLIPMVQRRLRGPSPDPTGATLRLVRRLSAEDFLVTGAVISGDGTISADP